MTEKRILTIQDASCVGQCSLTVALPIISACGIETAVLPSALLSTHTAGFTDFTVLDLTSEFPKITEHWKKENVTFDAVYTGYVLRSQIGYIKDICRTFNKGLKIIDPVMADHGAFYYGFDKDFARMMGELCQDSDVLLPNITEACFLLDCECKLSGYDEKYVEAICFGLIKKFNAKCVVLTGVGFDDSKLGVAVCKDGKISYYFSEKISQNFHGTGDIYSSSFVGALLNGLDEYTSAKIAVDYTCRSIKDTLPYKNEHFYGVFFEKNLKNLIKDIDNEKNSR